MFVFRTHWFKARRMPNPKRMRAPAQTLYSVELKSSGEFFALEVAGVGSVGGVHFGFRPCLRWIPSLSMRVINVVRLSPRQAAAPSGPPTRPAVLAGLGRFDRDQLRRECSGRACAS